MYVTSKNNNICPHYLSKDSISLIYAANNGSSMVTLSNLGSTTIWPS